MKTILSNPKPAALTSFLFTLPFLLLNTIAGNQIEPFYTIFKVDTASAFWDYPLGHLSLMVVLLLLPLGALIALWPGLQKRKMYFANILLGVLMLGCFFLISGAFIDEIYRCNVLLIPNCD